MALDYANFELVQNIKRNLKGTAPKEKLSEIEDKMQVVVPICSSNAPLPTREQFMDFDSAPKNYITMNVGAQTACAAVTWTTVKTIYSAAPNAYQFIWGLCVSCEVLQSFDWILTTDAADDSVTDSAVVLAGHVEAPLTGCAADIIYLPRPIPQPTGSYYVRILNLDAVNPHNFNAKVMIEIRKIENRDP